MKKITAKKLNNIGYLCGPCAVNLGLTWPKNHCATSHEGKCDVCNNEGKSLTSITDWLKPNEKELKSWD